MITDQRRSYYYIYYLPLNSSKIKRPAQMAHLSTDRRENRKNLERYHWHSQDRACRNRKKDLVRYSSFEGLFQRLLLDNNMETFVYNQSGRQSGASYMLQSSDCNSRIHTRSEGR